MMWGLLLFWIRIDPNVCFGNPWNPAHRIWVSLILDLLAGGCMTQEERGDHRSEGNDEGPGRERKTRAGTGY